MEDRSSDTGGKNVYIEEDQIETILTRPEVWPVPEAEDNILGLSVYGNELVVFYREGTVEEAPCGIIIRAGERLLGIGAQSLGEENVDREELEGIIPGVWERKID